MLVRSGREENVNLSILLMGSQSLQLNQGDKELLEDFFQQLELFCGHWQHFGQYESPAEKALETLEAMLPVIEQHYQSFVQVGVHQKVLTFFGTHLLFHYPEEEEEDNDTSLWEAFVLRLQRLLAIDDWLCLLSYSQKMPLLLRGKTCWANLQAHQVAKDNFVVLRLWVKNLYYWYYKLERVKNPPQWLLPPLQRLQTFLRSQSNISQALVDILGDLWFFFAKRFNHKMSALVAPLFQLSSVSLEQQKTILLQHPIFRCTENPLKDIGGMPPDDAYNLYNTTAEHIESYAQHFWEYQDLLEGLSPQKFAYFKERVYEAWSYFYSPALVPYLEYILQKAPNDALVHFYLAQAAVQANNIRQAIDYYQAYLVFCPIEIPKNNFFISEMHYATRTYPPSSLEAIVHSGYLYEKAFKREEQAIDCYERSIALAPNHHQAGYWELIQLMVRREAFGTALLDLVLKYVDILFYKTSWLNPRDKVYNILVEIDTYRRGAIAWKEHLAVYEKDFDRKMGFVFLKPIFLSLLWELAEHFLEEEEHQLSFEATVAAKQLLKVEHIDAKKYDSQFDYPIPCYPVEQADLLYLQAVNIEALTQDYWQAQSLYKQLLKEDPHHQAAQEGLARVKQYLGY